MNYIRHLIAFYDKLATDERFTPAHVSLYLALFQCWNMNHFENPFSVNRKQVLKFCKIGSNHTYYKALKDLQDWGYIQYDPSFSSAKGSHLCIFAQVQPETELKSNEEECKNDIGSGAEMHRDVCKIDIGAGAKMHPSLNNININNKTLRQENSQTQNSKNENSDFEKQESLFQEEPTPPKTAKRKKVAPKKEKANVPSNIDDVLTFFKQENYPELEARKFYNHFQSNGWKVGGKAPMKDWHAAAHNWILNSGKFGNPAKHGPTSLNTKKRYDTPL